MISGWLKRKIYDAGYKSGLKDIDRFILSVKGQSDEEVGLLIAVATIIRVSINQDPPSSPPALSNGLNPALQFEVSEPDHANTQMFVSSLVKMYQKEGNRNIDAAGSMVWLHSLRSQGYPELRIKGRELWTELSRGFPHVEGALDEIDYTSGKDIPDAAYEQYRFVPAGIEPR